MTLIDDDGVVAAGIDVGKASMKIAVRTRGPRGGDVFEVESFATTTAGIASAGAWLGARGVDRIGMESTSEYWKPVFAGLEMVAPQVWLLNAYHARHVPGRKTDVTDAQWLAVLTAHGLVRPSFVPAQVFRDMRALTRRRAVLVAERGREKTRAEKLLEDAGIKLSTVVSDLFGVSGFNMMRALCQGQRDPQVLAQMARGSMRRKNEALIEALTGHFSDDHGFVLASILESVCFIDAQITGIAQRLTQITTPFTPELELLATIPGIDKIAAIGILAEIGDDMTRFPTHKNLAAWAGVCPTNNITGGHGGRTRMRKGNKHLKRILGAAAMAASGSKHTYLGALYRRIRTRRGSKRAIGALMHSITVAIWHMLTHHQPYKDPGRHHFDNPHTTGKQHHRWLTELTHHGYTITPPPTPHPDTAKTPPPAHSPLFS